MKKLPIILLSTLITGLTLGPAHLAHASIEENSTTWWSVEELLNYYPEVEAEKDAECGDNQDCRMEFNFNMIEKGEKYRALSNLTDMQFWVTGVNPKEQTISVLFFDDEMMLRRMGIEEKITLEKLVMGWFNEWNDQIFHHSYEELVEGEVSDFHLLYVSTPESLNDVMPWKEVKLGFSDPYFADNASGKIAYQIFAQPFNAVGSFDYSSCKKSPDYKPDKECKMYVSADQWVTYLPSRNENEPNELVSQNPPADTLPSDLELTPPVEELFVIEQPITDNPIKSSEDSREELVNSETATTSTPEIKAPNTGIGGCEHVVEFPWWFMLMLLIGDIVALWFFWPTKSKKSRKNV